MFCTLGSDILLVDEKYRSVLTGYQTGRTKTEGGTLSARSRWTLVVTFRGDRRGGNNTGGRAKPPRVEGQPGVKRTHVRRPRLEGRDAPQRGPACLCCGRSSGRDARGVAHARWDTEWPHVSELSCPPPSAFAAVWVRPVTDREPKRWQTAARVLGPFVGGLSAPRRPHEPPGASSRRTLVRLDREPLTRL